MQSQGGFPQESDTDSLRPKVVGPGMGGAHIGSLEDSWNSLAYTIFNPSTIAWSAIGALAVYLFGIYSNVYWDANFQIVAAGLIFPKSFAISNAFGRREFSLRALARLKVYTAICPCRVLLSINSCNWTITYSPSPCRTLAMPRRTASRCCGHSGIGICKPTVRRTANGHLPRATPTSSCKSSSSTSAPISRRVRTGKRRR